MGQQLSGVLVRGLSLAWSAPVRKGGDGSLPVTGGFIVHRYSRATAASRPANKRFQLLCDADVPGRGEVVVWRW